MTYVLGHNLQATTHRDQLQRLRDRYDGRRTIARELLDEAIGLADAAIAETHAVNGAQLTEQERQHQAQLERADEQHQRQLERAEQRAERAQARVRELEDMRTNFREKRETIDEGVQVRIEAPRTTPTSYATDGYPRPWTLGELDTLAHRLRVAGASDDTEVRFKSDHVEACVPFPEFALEPTRKAEPAAEVDVAQRRWPFSWTRREWASIVALWVVSAAVFGLVVTVR